MFTKEFWLDAFERASKTFAQSLVAAPFAAAAMGLITAGSGAELKFILLNALFAAIASVFTSIASIKLGTRGTASVTHIPVETTLEELSLVPPPPNNRDESQDVGAIPPALAGR